MFFQLNYNPKFDSHVTNKIEKWKNVTLVLKIHNSVIANKPRRKMSSSNNDILKKRSMKPSIVLSMMRGNLMFVWLCFVSQMEFLPLFPSFCLRFFTSMRNTMRILQTFYWVIVKREHKKPSTLFFQTIRKSMTSRTAWVCFT